MVKDNSHPVVVGITGASGAALARTTIDYILDRGYSVVASVSPAAKMVWRQEIDESFGDSIERWVDSGEFAYYPSGDLTAPIASGTFQTLGMVIVPASMSTVAAVAHGLSDNLIRRAADVCLKENRSLVLVPRETPLTHIHLDNMGILARMGATILPPQPAFYMRQQTIAELIDFVALRSLLALDIIEKLPEKWRYRGPRGLES